MCVVYWPCWLPFNHPLTVPRNKSIYAGVHILKCDCANDHHHQSDRAGSRPHCQKTYLDFATCILYVSVRVCVHVYVWSCRLSKTVFHKKIYIFKCSVILGWIMVNLRVFLYSVSIFKLRTFIEYTQNTEWKFLRRDTWEIVQHKRTSVRPSQQCF